jgi:choline-sulfatase
VSGDEPGRRPNVLVVLTDQQRWDTLGINGNPLELTPQLDELGRRGLNIQRAFTSQPVCAPSRASLLTGRFATEIGVHRNDLVLDPGIPTLGHAFAAAGYDTGYIGKWHLAGTGTAPVPKELRGGFDHWLAADIVELMSDAYEPRLYDGGGELVELDGYRSDAYVDAAVEYVRAPRDRPFFLFVSLLEPHHQNHRDDYPAPHGYAQRYEDAWSPADLEALGGTAREQLPGYLGMVRRIDEGLGRLLASLDAAGVREDTIVLFTSDHGCHFKTRNGEYKRSAHDASIRVPLVLDGPGFTGRSHHGMVSLVDVAPTLLAAAGIQPLGPLSGQAIGEPARDRVFVQISESQVGRAIRTDRWKYAVRAPDADPLDAASDHYVEDLLYDLENDPHELENLVASPDHGRIRAALSELLLDELRRAGEGMPEIVPLGALSGRPDAEVGLR